MLYGIDISNLQGHPDTYRNQQWYKDAEFVIVQAIDVPAGYPGRDFIDPETGKHGYTGVQLHAAVDDGKYVGIYTWLWNDYSGNRLIADQKNRLACIPNSITLNCRPWLDVEDTSPVAVADRRDDVMVALGVLDAYALDHDLPDAGIYTGQWYIDGPSYLGGWFPGGRKLWLANYAIPAAVDENRVMHQFTSTPVDKDLMLDSEIVTENQMEAIDFVPQEYQDKFGAKTPQDVYANLEGIIQMLQSQQADPAAAAKLAQIKAIIES